MKSNLKAITEEEFKEKLNVLPPIRHGSNKGIYSFFFMEMYSGTWTTQYASESGVCLSKMVDLADPQTWITMNNVKYVRTFLEASINTEKFARLSDLLRFRYGMNYEQSRDKFKQVVGMSYDQYEEMCQRADEDLNAGGGKSVL